MTTAGAEREVQAIMRTALGSPGYILGTPPPRDDLLALRWRLWAAGWPIWLTGAKP